MSIIIGIDHGYYAIKTAHCSFPAGLTSYGEHEPYTRQGLLEFGGCFFVCGTGRQPIPYRGNHHLNTKHYHNHIVWSAVSLEDGKKYHSNSKSYYTEVRALSDALCQKYGLSIIETPESLRGKRQYEKWRAEENNQPTWRTAIRQDVDEAIQQSLTWRQFLSTMERKGYEVRMQPAIRAGIKRKRGLPMKKNTHDSEETA